VSTRSNMVDPNLERAKALVELSKFPKASKKYGPAYSKVLMGFPSSTIDSLIRKIRGIPKDAPHFNEQALLELLKRKDLAETYVAHAVPSAKVIYALSEKRKQQLRELADLEDYLRTAKAILPQRPPLGRIRLNKEQLRKLKELVIAHELDEKELADKYTKGLIFKRLDAPRVAGHIAPDILLRESNRLYLQHDRQLWKAMAAVRMVTGEYSLLKSCGINYGKEYISPGSNRYKAAVKRINELWSNVGTVLYGGAGID